ncbi:unnamed protein product, partial [Brassica oleracea var. botrytis]
RSLTCLSCISFLLSEKIKTDPRSNRTLLKLPQTHRCSNIQTFSLNQDQLNQDCYHPILLERPLEDEEPEQSEEEDEENPQADENETEEGEENVAPHAVNEIKQRQTFLKLNNQIKIDRHSNK